MISQCLEDYQVLMLSNNTIQFDWRVKVQESNFTELPGKTAWLSYIHGQLNVRLRSEERSNMVCTWWAFDREWFENQKIKGWIWKTKMSLSASAIWNSNLKGRMCRSTVFLEKIFLTQTSETGSLVHWFTNLIHCWFLLKISAKLQL